MKKIDSYSDLLNTLVTNNTNSKINGKNQQKNANISNKHISQILENTESQQITKNYLNIIDQKSNTKIIEVNSIEELENILNKTSINSI